jgi:hypothetical protein
LPLLLRARPGLGVVGSCAAPASHCRRFSSPGVLSTSGSSASADAWLSTRRNVGAGPSAAEALREKGRPRPDRAGVPEIPDANEPNERSGCVPSESFRDASPCAFSAADIASR